jgi:hypothetical protein
LSKPNIEKMDLKMIVRGILKRVEERYWKSENYIEKRFVLKGSKKGSFGGSEEKHERKLKKGFLKQGIGKMQWKIDKQYKIFKNGLHVITSSDAKHFYFNKLTFFMMLRPESYYHCPNAHYTNFSDINVPNINFECANEQLKNCYWRDTALMPMTIYINTILFCGSSMEINCYFMNKLYGL